MRRRKNNVKLLAFGSSLAAMAGYIAGLLTAPQSGKKSRKELAKATVKSSQEAEKDLKKLTAELNDVLKEAKTQKHRVGSKAHRELKELTEKAQDNKEKVREIISALHEGDAPDHDLSRAVKDANRALEHLKDYLKK